MTMDFIEIAQELGNRPLPEGTVMVAWPSTCSCTGTCNCQCWFVVDRRIADVFALPAHPVPGPSLKDRVVERELKRREHLEALRKRGRGW